MVGQVKVRERFYVRHYPEFVGRQFYVVDGWCGRTVGRAWGAAHYAQREADRRNAMSRAFHGGS